MIAIHHIINVKGLLLQNLEVLNGLYSPELTAASLAKIHDLASWFRAQPGVRKV